MTDVVTPGISAPAATKKVRRDIGIKRRYAAERRFRAYGVAAISFGLLFLFLLLWSVIGKGYTAFQQTMITIPVEFSQQIIDPDNVRAQNPSKLMTANYPVVARNSLAKVLGVSLEDRTALRAVNALISDSVRTQLRDIVTSDPNVIGTTRTVSLLASGDVDSAFKGQVDMSGEEQNRRISDQQVGWMNELVGKGALEKKFNTGIFFNGASSRPEASGVGVALIGSFYMMLIVLVLSLPIGVAASIYLEEFAPKNRLTDLIEVNINNLAAVPSVVLRPARSRRVPRLLRTAALGLAGRWSGADADDAADHHHRHTRCLESRAAFDPRRSARSRCLENADHLPPRAAACHARHPDRHHHRPCARAWRNRAAPSHRHGGLRGELPDDPT